MLDFTRPIDNYSVLLQARLRSYVLRDEEADTLSPAEARAIAEADGWLKHNGPIPHDDVLAEFGLSVADWEKMSTEP